MPKSIPDGLSNTILFAERYHGCGSGGSYWAGGNYNVSTMAMFLQRDRTRVAVPDEPDPELLPNWVR